MKKIVLLSAVLLGACQDTYSVGLVYGTRPDDAKYVCTAYTRIFARDWILAYCITSKECQDVCDAARNKK